MSDFQELTPTYEYTIRCLVCNYTYSVGGFKEQPELQNIDVKNLAQHNRGCKVIGICCPNLLSISSSVIAEKNVVTLTYEIQLL